MKLAWATMIAISLIAISSRPLAAQDQAQPQSGMSAAGCGPAKVEFSVKTDKNAHPATQPDPGKALVYVFEQEKLDPGLNIDSGVTIRVGVDGKWVGADYGASYLAFPVDPGNHNVCVNWQSSIESRSKQAAALSLDAEPGRVYYFSASVDLRTHRPETVRLEVVDPAESNILLAQSAQSASHPKK